MCRVRCTVCDVRVNVCGVSCAVQDRVPLWSVLPSLVLSLVGVYLWKHWERSTEEEARRKSLDGAVFVRTAAPMAGG
jgi:hypothetical protein